MLGSLADATSRRGSQNFGQRVAHARAASGRLALRCRERRTPAPCCAWFWQSSVGPLPVPNAVQLSLPDAAPPPTRLAYADFAAGCFWGLQQLLSRTPGVLETTAGYTQGAPRERPPTYGRVSSGKTGHVEAVRALYDPVLVSYEGLLAVYMASLEDACDARGQGADRGFQYRPGIYWHDEAQRAAAEAALAAEAAARRVPALAVELKPATAFWEAEEVHQHYLERGGLDPQPEVPYWLGCYVDVD